MRKYSFFLTFVIAIASVNAQSKLDLGAQMLLSDYFNGVKTEISTHSCNDEKPLVTVLVKLLSAGEVANVILPESAEITGQYGSVITVKLPLADLEAFADQKSIVSISLSKENEMMMNSARPASKVTQVQDGTELDRSYDGTGVVTGLMDQGIDPNHVNFMNSTLTATRVMEAYAYTGADGVPTKSATTPDEVLGFTTDDAGESHGTHVAGIMAGSYKGEGDYVVSGKRVSGDIPYWGVATGSDIVMAGGNLYDANILNGVKRVIEYAEKEKKPAVVNLSLGSLVGPHDGTSSLSEGLAALGERAIICVATGNDADKKCAVNLGPFNRLKKSFNTGIPVFSKTTANIIQFWGDDSDGFDIDFVIYSTLESKVVTTLTLAKGTNGIVQLGGAGTNYPHDDFFNEAFTDKSYIRMQGQVDNVNNRYYVYVSSNLVTGTGSYYVPGVRVYNKVSGEGTVYGYTKEGEFTNYSVNAWKDGTSDGSISDMATGANIVAVGAYVSASNFSFLAKPGSSYTYGENVNSVASFSSFGPNVVTGENLPVICAPGTVIISSVNNFNQSFNDENTSALAYVNARSNRWGPMQGTSMACPYVSGTVALWLEADPTLSSSEVIDILKTTAIKPSTTDELKLKQWGGGKLDALAGIKEVLRRKGESGGIDGVLADAEGYVVTPVGDRGFNVVVDGAGVVSASLYNLQGVAVARAEAQGNEVTLEADGVAPGVYVLSIETPNTARIARRILLR